MGRAPLLIIITMILTLLGGTFGGPQSIIGLPFEILLAGFLGTQRVWFARLYRGDKLRGREVWPMLWSFIGRFVALGFLIAVCPYPSLVVLTLCCFALDVSLRTIVAINIAYGLFRRSRALTFVVPALALTTHSVRAALGIGLRMIRETWPRCAWYVFTPGLTLVIVAQVFRPASQRYIITTVTLAMTSVLALWFKGAIVAFYLRQNPAPVS